RIAACLAYEEHVVRQGVRREALRALHYLFATQADLERADFKAMLGLGERLATAQVTALLKRGLLLSDTPYGKVRQGVPQHALRFYFPSLWPEAEAQA
ncbi:MAG: Fic family protein, partial [Betaproteobacteria bacterium]|nr:Fic family protein [Betaproteobacteria bacterium]